MTFLSSKVIKDIEQTFFDIKNGTNIKEAEQRLQNFKNIDNYQLYLATFMSRCKDYNSKCLAVLELKKKLYIQDEQVIWLLKQLYFQQEDSISKIIQEIMTRDNFKWAGLFITKDFQQMGIEKCLRYLTYCFKILNSKRFCSQFLAGFFSQFYEGLQNIIGNIIESEELLLMYLVILAMYYEKTLIIDQSLYIKRIQDHWINIESKIQQRIDHKNIVIIQTLNSLLLRKEFQPEKVNFQIFFDQIFSSLLVNKTFTLKIYSKYLQFIIKYSKNLFTDDCYFLFARSFTKYALKSNRKTFSELLQHKQIQLNSKYQYQISEQYEKLLIASISFWIQQLFLYRNQRGRYLLNNLSLSDCLALLNYYNSSDNPDVFEWISENMHNIINSYININCHNDNSKFNNQVSQVITYLQFFTKYKNHITIQQLPQVIYDSQDIAIKIPPLSYLCSNLYEEMWENLSTLDMPSLVNFLIIHLKKLNENIWSHKYQCYTAFLELARHLETNYQYFSAAAYNEELLKQTISSFEIMIDLLQLGSKQQGFQGDVFNSLLFLAYSILKNSNIGNLLQMSEKLRIQTLRQFIIIHDFQSTESIQITLMHKFIMGEIVESLKKDGIEWQIDQENQQNSDYQIYKYERQIEYCKGLISTQEIVYYQKSLAEKIANLNIKNKMEIENINQNSSEEFNQDLLL